MTTYVFEFFGRKNNAIGVTHHICAARTAPDQKAAQLALYDEFELISRLVCTSAYDRAGKSVDHLEGWA